MRKVLLTMLSLLGLCLQLLAQNRTISGRVTDDRGAGLANASVTIKNSNVGTTTDQDGNFILSIPANARALIVSSVGLGQKEINITSSNTYSVALSSTVQDLQEVVVVGYQTRRKRDEAGAISTVRA